MKLKTKLSLGVSFLFVVILIFGILAVFFITKLGNESASILKNNHESLVYSNNMLQLLDKIKTDNDAVAKFDSVLRLQENNITETGEKNATVTVRSYFTKLQSDKNDSTNYTKLRVGLHTINELNQRAILQKNNIAIANAGQARFWLTFIFCILIIIALTFTFNFPSVIATPISKLTDGIREIAEKNYQKRIFLKQNDEFGELANSFNTMAEKLDEYEHSNLAQVRFEKSRIETVISQMKDAVIGLDAKQQFLFMNTTAEQLLGLSEKDVVGKFAPDIALYNDLIRTLLSSEGTSELKIYANNKESFFNKDMVNITSNGHVIGQLIVLKNITPFHELSEAKTNFIATVSHELKTPISSIKMSARLLDDERVGKLNEEQQKLVVSIKDDADRLLKITSELLNMSQAETGRIQLKMQPAIPETIVQEAIKTVELKAQLKHIAINSSSSDSLPLVYADIEKTSWVLINLLTNAIKYSPENTTIHIGITADENDVIFSVKDEGKGITADDLPRVFDRYFKGEASTEGNDTGLGLSISKEFIEAQGGKIGAESHIGKGSAFHFKLKVHKGTA